MGVNRHPAELEQLSDVHKLLSLQVMGVKTHPPMVTLQVSAVQVLLSLQLTGVQTTCRAREAVRRAHIVVVASEQGAVVRAEG